MKLFTNIINIAVPMFIFIAGYKYEMTRDSRKIKLYYKNKIKKIIMPTLIISVIWIMFLLGTSILKKLIIGEYVDFYEYIKIFILRIFQIIIGKNDIYQLWYIPMYISITFLFPIIDKYIIDKYRIIIFVMTSVLQVIGSMHLDILSRHPFDFVYYFIFFELGILCLKKNKIVPQKVLYMMYVFILLISTIIDNIMIVEVLLKLILYPIGVWVFYYFSIRLENNKLLNIIGEYSFYIFILHEPLIMSGIYTIFYKLGLGDKRIGIFIVTAITIIICVFLYKIIIRIWYWNKSLFINIKGKKI